jgi:acetyl-CoA carboxylase carboxyl transferase subunit alpha
MHRKGERILSQGAELTVFNRMKIAKNKDRPNIIDYTRALFPGFIELHGDRAFGDDLAIYAGIGYFDGNPVTVIGHRKGKNFAENQKVNFGMPNPEGYRKALRLMKQAEKFQRPILCFVDTPGAYPGLGAEERGQGEAIAVNLREMMCLKTPIVSIVTGEGGSGGALALAVCDGLGMLQNAVYSVISPKGFASILWKDPSREQEAAQIMKITAEDLVGFGVADAIIPEPDGGAHKNMPMVFQGIESFIRQTLDRCSKLSHDQLLAQRYERYRKIGVFAEGE